MKMLKPLVSFISLFCFTYAILDDTRYISKEGKLMIGFVDNFSTKIKPHQMQNILTFQRTVEQFSKPVFGGDAGDADIGYVMFLTTKEDCINDMLHVLKRHPNIIAFVGPRISYYVLTLSSVLSSFRIPTFVYGSSILSDYMLESLGWKYVLPMTATATGQANTTLPRVLKSIGADIVSVIYDDTDYARPQLPILLKSLKNHEIDVKRSSMLTEKRIDESTLTGVLKDMKEAEKDNRTLVIVTLVFHSRIAQSVDWLLQQFGNDSNPEVLVVTSSSGCVMTVEESWAERGVHVIRSCQTYSSIPDLELYFRNTALLWDGERVTNTLLLPSTTSSEQGNCSVGDNPCFRELLLGNEAIGRPFSSYNHRIYYAVRALLLALQSSKMNLDLLRQHSERASGLEPFNSDLSSLIIQLFKHESDQFESGLHFGENETRSVPFLHLGLILDSGEAVDWREDSSEEYKPSVSSYLTNRIKCSLTCSAGYYMYKDPQQLAKNCWECEVCQGNSYSNSSNSPECPKCGEGSWSVLNKTSCSSETSSLHLLHHPYGNVVLTIGVISVLLISITFVLYVQLWESHVIVASGRDLAVFMFPGMLCGLVDAALLASPPGAAVCTAVQVLSHMFVMLIIPPIFVRTLRIVVVFKCSVSHKNLVQYVTKKYVYLHMLVVLMPVLIFLVYGLSDPIFRFTERVTEEGYFDGVYKVTASCAPTEFTLVYLLIAYVIAVLLLATIMGFKTRKLPENYKESLHIFMCALITLALVLCYVPAMILIPGERQVFSLAVIVAVLSVTVNGAIFLPKIYLCIRYPELRRRKPSTVTNNQNSAITFNSYACKNNSQSQL